MSNTKTDKPAPTRNVLGSALAEASAQAAAVEQRTEPGRVLAGPFPVGNIGQVEVRAVTRGSTEFTQAVYRPASGGKAQRIPLAAVATLHEELGA